MFHLFLDQFLQGAQIPVLILPSCDQDHGLRKTLERFDDRPDIGSLGVVVETNPPDLPDKLKTMLKTFEPIENVLDRLFRTTKDPSGGEGCHHILHIVDPLQRGLG